MMIATSRSASESPAACRPIVVLGNPENRRVRMFCAAALRLQLRPPQVIAYEAVLAGNIDPRDFVAPGDRVRIESPGENEIVHRTLVARGAAASNGDVPFFYDPAEKAEFGQIDHPGLWYRGFSALLDDWERALDPRPVAWMNYPSDIRLLFDKAGCRQHLENLGIPVPASLGTVKSYSDLRARMRERGASRVFLKLNYGSSASGIVAFRAQGPRLSAVTSVEMVAIGRRVRLFNSLRVREYHQERDVAALFDALGPLGLESEAWIPKASCQGGVFDLRVLSIAGEPRHAVVRIARGPMTNLHLGNRRGNFEALMATIDKNAREAAWETCRRVAMAFPRSLYLGIDLMFTPKLKRHYVLEVNAFGDLLPGVIHRGEDTYSAELQACWQA
jgi:hypothetical protein